jgi:hypothetical protein
MRDFCKGCIWQEVDEDLDYCIMMQNSSLAECPRFFKLEDENEDTTCSTCQRDKDPGKCWWCGTG